MTDQKPNGDLRGQVSFLVQMNGVHSTQIAGLVERMVGVERVQIESRLLMRIILGVVSATLGIAGSVLTAWLIVKVNGG